MGDFRRLKTSWTKSPQAADGAVRGAFNPESVSAVLRNTRILQGYHDIAEVAREIKVRRNYLEAIEDGRFHDLPAIVYAQGFVTSYAKFLGLDVEDMVERYKAEAGAPLRGPEVAAPVKRASAAEDGRGESRLPDARILFSAVGLVLLAYLAWQAAGTNERANVLAVPPLPSELQKDNEASAAVASSDAPTPIEPPPAPPVPVVVAPVTVEGIALRALADSFVQVYGPNGAKLASLQLRAGESYTLPEVTGPVKVASRTPENLQVVAGEKRYSLPASKGQPMEVWLDTAKLRAAATAPAATR